MIVSSERLRLEPGGSSRFLSARYLVIKVVMTGQATLITKIRKRPGPAPSGQGTLIGVRLHEAELKALDAFALSQDGKPSRPEAIRRILRERLIRPAS
jgi:Ribbon-helix-helix protein, copG family